MKHTKTNCSAYHLIIGNCCGLECSNCEAHQCAREDKPEYGKQYALTGDNDSKSIMNGNTWAESEVKISKSSGGTTIMGKGNDGQNVLISKSTHKNLF